MKKLNIHIIAGLTHHAVDHNLISIKELKLQENTGVADREITRTTTSNVSLNF